MQEEFENIKTALVNLANAILAISPTETRTLNEIHGWNQASLTCKDIAEVPLALANRLDTQLPEVSDSEAITRLKTIPEKILRVQMHTIPQLGSSNAVHAVPAIMSTIEWIEVTLEPLLNWQLLNDTSAMPSRMARRLKLLQSQIEEVAIDKEKLKDDINIIQDARRTADSLPVDLQDLKESKLKVASISTEAAILIDKINRQTEEAVSSSVALRYREEEATKIIALCQEAYRTATSTGLAGAFDVRAKSLNQSMWSWVIGLISALVGGGVIAAIRYESISKELAKSDLNWSAIWIHIGLSLVGVLPTIWLAWLATKQISQRFRLSEDYAFKASIAKAYEGYKREAASINIDMEARLFSSALTRLEEAPLRLVEQENHGSPFHELFNSAAFLKAMDMVPGLAEQVGNVYRKSKLKKPTNKKAPAVAKEDVAE